MPDVAEMSEAERRAHEACPLKHDYTGQTCEYPDGPALIQCDEQHAAITALAREAHLAGRLEQAGRDAEMVTDADHLHLMNTECQTCAVHRRMGEEIDRLRALKESEHGG